MHRMNRDEKTLAPEFKKVLRGYDPAQVNEYISKLQDECGELRRKNREIDGKLSSVLSQYADFKEKREELDRRLENIDAESAAAMAETRRRCSEMLDDTRKSCDKLQQEMRSATAAQRSAFIKMHEMVLSFRSDLFEKYNSQIDSIDSLASLADAYDEAMMFCMRKNGVDDDAAAAATAADMPTENDEQTEAQKMIEKGAADTAPVTAEDIAVPEHHTPREEPLLTESVSFEEAVFPGGTFAESAIAANNADGEMTFDFYNSEHDATPADDSNFGYSEEKTVDESVRSDDGVLDDASAYNNPDYNTSDYHTPDYNAPGYGGEASAYAGGDSDGGEDSDVGAGSDIGEGSDIGAGSDGEDWEEFVPEAGGGYTYSDYSFGDEDDAAENVEELPPDGGDETEPDGADMDKAHAEEPSDKDDSGSVSDFDIYHASGDQLLEMIYGSGAAGDSEFTLAGQKEIHSGKENPMHGVDYKFPDPDEN